MEGSYKHVAPCPPVTKKQPLKSCLCCSLKVGSLVVGWFHVIVCMLAIPIIIAALTLVINSSSDSDEHYGNSPPIYLKEALGLFLFGVTMIFLLHVTLLFGVYKKNTSVMTAYIISFACIMCLRIVETGISISYIHAPCGIFLQITSIGLEFLGLLIVYSYKVELYNERLVSASQSQDGHAEDGQKPLTEAPPPYDPYCKA